MKGADDKAVLISGPIAPMLARLTLPMIAGIMGMVAFNLVDTFFVGQLGTAELAALSFTFPVVLVVSSLAMGIGIGASAVISRAIGQGDQEEVRRLTTDSLILGLICVAALSVIGLSTIDPLFRALGATDETLPLISSYMRIWYLGMVFVVVPMVGNNAIRATGDTKTPSAIMLVAVAVNTVLDPLLIFGIGPFPRLELAGAAIATVCARTTTMTVALWVLGRRERMLTAARPSMSALWQSWKRILYIGVPTAATRAITPFAVGVVTRLTSAYGPAAVAAFGVASRIEFFCLTVIFALATVLTPFVGQNWGARRFGRIRKAFTLSSRFAIGWGLFSWLALAVLAQYIAPVFNDDPAVTAGIVSYLRIVPLGFGMLGVFHVVTTMLNALNRPLTSAGLTAAEMFGLYIPFALIGSHLYGLPGLFAGLGLAYLVAGASAYVALRRILSRDDYT